MSSKQTPIYGLNQWSLEDGVIMEEFNTDNRKIEQALVELKTAMPKIATGSYVGTGTAGEEYPNTLTFDFEPKFIAIFSNEEDVSPNNENGGVAPWLFVRPWKYTNRHFDGSNSNYSYKTYVTWLDNGASWYAQHGDGTPNPAGQLNAEGRTYHYLAIG